VNRSKSLPIIIAIAVLICLVPVFPGVFGALIGIGVIVIVAAFILGGFVFALDHWGVKSPIWILLGVLMIGLVWPPVLGLVVGLGAVGGLFMALYVVIRESGR
jgi:hypothetical protein